MNNETIGVIGGGNMGTAIVAGIRDHFSVSVCEKEKKRAAFLRRIYKVKTADVNVIVNESSIIILAVKPQDFDSVLTSISKLINKDKLVISIAAGVTTSYIEAKIGKSVRVVRTMPNLPVQVLKGFTAICSGKYAKTVDVKTTAEIFKHLGETQIVKESTIDSLTAVSGSGPAYIFMFAESIRKAATALGLDKKVSNLAVLQTLIGSATLLEKNKKIDFSKLRQQVTSKGGTTEAALNTFIKNGFDKICCDAVKSAQLRAKELAKK